MMPYVECEVARALRRVYIRGRDGPTSFVVDGNSFRSRKPGLYGPLWEILVYVCYDTEVMLVFNGNWPQSSVFTAWLRRKDANIRDRQLYSTVQKDKVCFYIDKGEERELATLAAILRTEGGPDLWYRSNRRVAYSLDRLSEVLCEAWANYRPLSD
jgi:hypothetical protein